MLARTTTNNETLTNETDKPSDPFGQLLRTAMILTTIFPFALSSLRLIEHGEKEMARAKRYTVYGIWYTIFLLLAPAVYTLIYLIYLNKFP